MDNKQQEKLIASYDAAQQDSAELIAYIDRMDSPDDLIDFAAPSVVKELQDSNSNRFAVYKECAAITGGNVAMAVNNMERTKKIAGKVAEAVVGASVFIALAPVALIPLSLVGPVVGMVSGMELHRYLKKNKGELQEKSAKIKTNKNKLQGWIAEIEHKLADNAKRTKIVMEKGFADFSSKANEDLKNLSIKLDDLVNMDTNKRIFQYNQVILDQYKALKLIEEKTVRLRNEYIVLQKEKEELELQLSRALQMTGMLTCSESVIEDALSRSK